MLSFRALSGLFAEYFANFMKFCRNNDFIHAIRCMRIVYIIMRRIYIDGVNSVQIVWAANNDVKKAPVTANR